MRYKPTKNTHTHTLYDIPFSFVSLNHLASCFLPLANVFFFIGLGITLPYIFKRKIKKRTVLSKWSMGIRHPRLPPQSVTHEEGAQAETPLPLKARKRGWEHTLHFPLAAIFVEMRWWNELNLMLIENETHKFFDEKKADWFLQTLHRTETIRIENV